MSQVQPLANQVVFPDEIAPNVWRINQPVVELEPGQTVTFDPAGLVARLWIPARNLLDKSAEVTQLDCAPVTFQVAADIPDGYYPYGFYLMGKNLMVEGNSPPYIRIRKPTPAPGDGN